MTPAEVIARAETDAVTLRVALSDILAHMEEIDDELDCLAAIRDTAKEALTGTPDAGMVVVPAEDLNIVMNDLKASWERYVEACTRLRAALPERPSANG